MRRPAAALGRTLLRVLGALGGARRSRTLVWHGIGEQGGPLAVSRADFARQLDALLAAGASFDTAGAVATGRPRAGRSVALTFDDGLAGAVREAVPELADRGLPATMFVVTGEVGARPSWPARDAERIARDLRARLGRAAGRALAAVEAVLSERLATWEELAAAAARGIEVLPHSRRHRFLDDAGDAELEDEIGGAVADLAAAGFPPAGAIAWPYGVTNERAIAVARRAGLAGGFVVERNRRRGRGDDPFRRERVPMEGVLTAAHVRFVLGPGYELRAVLRRLGRRAQ